MKKALALLLIIVVTSTVSSRSAYAAARGIRSAPAVTFQDDQEDGDYDTYFSSEELENLAAPVALYPDPLLAQVLLAATFPDQIDEAARTVRGSDSDYAIDDSPWDVSVKAVAHYPTVLKMMADKIDWTTSLGQAYVNQSTDVMDAVQRLRREASSNGYLVNSPQQEIDDTDGYLYIYPEQPQYIYVPAYDPAIVFVARPGFHVGPAIFFGTGFLIGAWLNHDCDWRDHRVFYHGWEGGPSWIQRSRPHIRITNIYVTNNYRNVVVNRRVNDRHVNYGALNRYNTVHHDVDYNNVRRVRRTDAGSRTVQPSRGNAGPRPAQQPAGNDNRDNKIIRRNIDPKDPRIDANRGHRQPNQSPPPVQQPNVQQPSVQQPNVQQPNTSRGDDRRNPRPVPATTLPAQVPRTDQTAPQPPRPPSVFRGGGGGAAGVIDAHAASQRGHESRQQQNQVAPRQAPRQQAPNPQRGQQNPQRGRGR